MNAEAAAIENLSVRASRATILSVAKLRFDRGEMLALLGPNGAGKSTLLRCLLGIQPHARGRVEVLGQDITSLGPGRLAKLRRSIGYVPQLLPAAAEIPLTLREVVAIGRTGIAGLLRPLRRDDWRIIDEWLDRLGLADIAHRGFGEISGGEQRKTLIARAMVQQPQMLLLDEPTANLDMGWREAIVGTIENLYRLTALTVVLVCHELEALPPSCRRVVVLESGKVLDDGMPEEVLSTQTIASLYGRGLKVLKTGGRWAVVPAERAGISGEADHD